MLVSYNLYMLVLQTSELLHVLSKGTLKPCMQDHNP